MKNIIIVQARLTSKRLPSKVLLKIGNKRIIDLIYDRIKSVKTISDIIFAIPNNNLNKNLFKYLKNRGLKIFLGSEKNVLDRYFKAAKKYNADTIIRITADCPFADPKLIQEMLKFFKNNKFDYISNTIYPTYPDGLDVEIFSFKALYKCWKNAKSFYDREHVTSYIRTSKNFNIHNYEFKEDLSKARLTLDQPEDYLVIKEIFDKFKKNYNFNWYKASKYYIKNFDFMKNNHLIRNYKALSKSEKMWSRAIRVIPGGNSMVSKNPNMFVPNKWPTYFTKAKGCYVWDLDKRKYTDISLMGVGTNILGYSNSKIDKKVLQIVKAGNISSLNSHEEVLLAEKILSFNAWADKVLFTRTGAEANSASIRLSRIYTGKEKIAFCGYHGWHDWFLSASKKNEKVIRKNMLPYYSSEGIPRKLLNSVINFEYNNISSLEKILLNNKDIGAIKMEVIRNTAPKGNFLQNVRKLANKFNKILIFDECTTGFRETFGGIYKKYGIEPDMVIYGKALGNGYPISCVVGKKEIMDTKRKTFISSTFWTERIGPAAALETLKIMEKEKSWNIISKIGKKVKKNWQKLSLKYKIPLTIQGIPALTNFYFNDEKNNLKYRSFIIQYLLQKKYLASNIFYSSIVHTDEILDGYFSILDEAFYELSRSIKKQDLDQKLNYPISHNTFRK